MWASATEAGRHLVATRGAVFLQMALAGAVARFHCGLLVDA
jgi:hypothetical protein